MSSFGKTLGRIFRRDKEGESRQTAEEPHLKPPIIYLKALPLRKLSDVETIKEEVKSGNILIVKVTPLVERNPDEVEKVVDELCEFTESVGGDIARLGEERIVICPSGVKIWREPPKNSIGG